MKVFVTGGAGFIGSHVVDALIDAGHKVTVFDNLSKGYLENINSSADFINGDLNNVELLNNSIKGNDAVIHLASESIIQHSIDYPKEHLTRNFNYALNLLEAMRLNNIKKIVFSSSAAVYGETGNEPVCENSKKEPLQPYGASKLAVESMLSGYFHAFGINSTSLRYFNVYGPRDNQLPVTRAVPNWIKLTLSRKPIELFWEGKQYRDYIFVKDVAMAHVLALKKCNGLNNYNIGTGSGNTMKEILEAVFLTLGERASIIDSGERLGDPHRLVANIDKIKKEIGWYPKTRLDIGMKETVKFYRDNPKWIEKI